MIVDLPSTTTAAVSKRLIALREDVGSMALGRVLTLVVVVDEKWAEDALEVASAATRQHPARIVCVVLSNGRGAARLDAQIRVGGDAGASEVVVLRLFGKLTKHAPAVVTPLLLPDSPVVAWWPREAPEDVAEDPIGQMAQRRITDAAHSRTPLKALQRRGETYADGDTDMAWSRITLWRGLLAAALDQRPYEPVEAVTVTGATESPSADLLAAWLAYSLKCPVTLARSRQGSGIISVRLERKGGPTDLSRPQGDTATLMQPGQPDRKIALAHRSDAECLSDELHRLDPDEVYEDTLLLGIPKVAKARTTTASAASRKGLAQSEEEARKVVRRISRQTSGRASSTMVEAPAPAGAPSTGAVKKAAARRLAAKASTRTTKAKG
ncbi:MAG: glucose-6-phosphate dehydrogenase assembly protein OpcA [Micrococcales bacterium]|nr:glucose-6-phosphate dehydrogenase assembly protein OpcA [Micrococcales bacterium]